MHSKLLDELNDSFGPNGKNDKITFTELCALARQIYLRWMTNKALDAAHGLIPYDTITPHNSKEQRPSAVPVPGSFADTPNEDGLDGMLPGGLEIPDTSTAPQVGDDDIPLGTRDDESEWTAEEELAVPNIKEFESGDITLWNCSVFMRDALWYLEFNAAVREGDIGRVFEIIKAGNVFITPSYQFWTDLVITTCISSLDSTSGVLARQIMEKNYWRWRVIGSLIIRMT
jgi:hypothetical protein